MVYRCGREMECEVYYVVMPYSPASESRGKRCGLPIVVVTGSRGSSSNESGGASSKPSFVNVKTGDIIDVM